MTTIGINRTLKARLENERKENETMNDIITRLIDSCEDIEPYVPVEQTNIKVSEATFLKLKSLKQSPKESHNSVIIRLLNSQKCNSDD